MNNFQDLSEFLVIAHKNRKYSDSSYWGTKAAIKIFEPALNEDEKKSIDALKQNFDQIYSSVFNQNKNKFTATTIDVYRRRFLSLLEDYLKYGQDAKKMANWTPIIKKPKAHLQINKHLNDQEKISESVQVGTTMSRLEIAIRENLKAVVLIPIDLTQAESEKIINNIKANVSSGEVPERSNGAVS